MFFRTPSGCEQSIWSLRTPSPRASDVSVPYTGHRDAPGTPVYGTEASPARRGERCTVQRCPRRVAAVKLPYRARPGASDWFVYRTEVMNRCCGRLFTVQRCLRRVATACVPYRGARGAPGRPLYGKKVCAKPRRAPVSGAETSEPNSVSGHFESIRSSPSPSPLRFQTGRRSHPAAP